MAQKKISIPPLGRRGGGSRSAVPRPRRAGRAEHIPPAAPRGSKESTMKRLLKLEALETRDTPTAITLVGSTLQIDGSAYNDSANVSYDDRGTWWWPWDDQIHAILTNNGGES